MALKKLSISKKKLSVSLPKRVNFRSFRGIASVMVLASLVLLGGSGYVWYKNVLTDTNDVFYGMLSRNLQTDSVVRTVKQDSALRNVEQSYYVSFRPNAVAESTTTITQVGQDRQKTSVTTNTIGTKDADYVQYSDIQIPAATGKSDLSNILNKWAKRNNDPQTGQNTQFLSEAAFMFVPFGNVSDSDRAKLLGIIKTSGAYTVHQKGGVDYSSGRPKTHLFVTIKPKALVEVLSAYVKMTGVGDGAQLNPSDYEDSKNIDVELTVDVLSRHLNTLNFLTDSRHETYGSYGLNRKIEIPKQFISIDELQTRLQKLN